MTEQLVAPATAADIWKERDWKDLLDYVAAGQVIPIIGPDLVQVEHEGRKTLLDRYLADRLAAQYGLSGHDLPAEATLHVVVGQLMGTARADALRLYGDVHRLLQEANFPPPEPLRQLAEISDFNLFVTTTFDSLLEAALHLVSPGEAATSLRFVPNKRPDDLAFSKEQLPKRTVYYLMGKSSNSGGTYVISDEDLLEFVVALQSGNDARVPVLLFDALRENHLLLLGENFSDWLARLFLRTAKRSKLSDPRFVREIVADTHTSQDPNLVVFLRHFSKRTTVFPRGAIEFVAELHRRWVERNAKPKPDLPPDRMPRGAIFLSYAHEDATAVHEIYRRLTEAGLLVWFDKKQLKAGHNFNREIHDYIKDCSCFVPVISQTTETAGERFFREEWETAAQRDRRFPSDRQFIVPVVIDDTRYPPPGAPERFAGKHCEPAPAGQISPEIIQWLRDVVERNRQKTDTQ